MKQILIGLLGTIGAGKTTVSDCLVKKGFYRVIMGDLVREKATQNGLKLTRENLGKTQEEYRDKYGPDYFIKEAIKRLKDSKKAKLLVDGIRLPIDADRAKFEGAKLILADAPAEIRFERLKQRKREDDAQTIDKFMEQEKAEWKRFDFEKTLEYIDYTLNNSGNLEELYTQINDILREIDGK